MTCKVRAFLNINKKSKLIVLKTIENYQSYKKNSNYYYLSLKNIRVEE